MIVNFFLNKLKIILDIDKLITKIKFKQALCSLILITKNLKSTRDI